MNYLILTTDEIQKIRELLHKEIMSQQAGKYTVSNKLAKKIDKLMDDSEIE